MPLEAKPIKGRKNLYIRGSVTVWEDGKSEAIDVFQSARTTDQSEADAIAWQIETRIRQRNLTGHTPHIDYGQALIGYLDGGGSPRFQDELLDAFEHTPIHKIDQGMLDREGIKAYPAAAPSTRRRNWYTPFCAVLNHAGDRRKFQKPKEAGRRTDFLMPASAEKIIMAAAARQPGNPFAPALLTFLFGQGSRVGETLSMLGDDVHLDHNLAILRDTKNGHERPVTLTKRVKAALSTLPTIGTPTPLWRTHICKPYVIRANGGGQIKEMVGNAVADADLDPTTYTPHTFRHSWATWFYSQTKDVVSLKQEGGWRSGEWERYVQVSRPSIGNEAREFGWAFCAKSVHPDFDISKNG